MPTETLSTPIGEFAFELGGYPTAESTQKLFDALDFRGHAAEISREQGGGEYHGMHAGTMA